ncbi:MAG: PLP-dependent aspartate aminotransferase family protein [Gaiellaceae bacterium MAG52_C11]|nr:PLP-dependent aspartate aminotransferase family protein [Candidatus Gaiellasilicea maunaloa]
MEAPLDRSTIWPYEDGEPGPFYYARAAHPNGVAAERALGELEGGEAVLFASGTAATTAVALALLEPGKTIALADDAYYGTGVTLAELGRWGLRHVLFDQTGPPPEPADLVWIESPSNPLLTVPDFEAAAAHSAPVVCDATASTPIHLRALERGCDLVVHSATKYLAGHHDALLGAVVCRRAEDAGRLRAFRNATGAVAGPDAAWLLLRGLRTLEVRVLRQTETAQALAERLAADPAVTTVRYPGFGGLVSFDVPDGDAARRVETGTELIANATSLGGVASTIETRFRWEGTRVPPGLLRLSVGLEPVEELWADLRQALARV